ncbi:hypothetical protein [Longispora albida]|uniref:hypothetical protein n=1 Tax=Longispora albida TaxID=203523 RepID=UPI0003629753|nr:hypothetical protein [Longispora albida]
MLRNELAAEELVKALRQREVYNAGGWAVEVAQPLTGADPLVVELHLTGSQRYATVEAGGGPDGGGYSFQVMIHSQGLASDPLSFSYAAQAVYQAVIRIGGGF